MSLADAFLDDLLDSDDEMTVKTEDTTQHSQTEVETNKLSDQSATLENEASVLSCDLLASPDFTDTITLLKSIIEVDKEQKMKSEQSQLAATDRLIETNLKTLNKNIKTEDDTMDSSDSDDSDSDSDSDSEGDDEYSQISEVAAHLGDVDAEQALLDAASQLSLSVDHELHLIMRRIYDTYGLKYPELTNITSHPRTYIAVMRVLEQALDFKTRQEKLEALLPRDSIFTVTITYDQVAHKPLSPAAIDILTSGSAIAEELLEALDVINMYTQCRVTHIVPNLVALCGVQVAAQLLSLAGGIKGLVKVPSSHLQIIGGKRTTAQSGLGTNALGSASIHDGVIREAPILNSINMDHRKKATRMIANKAALAIRADAAGGSPDGSEGKRLYLEIEKKVRFWSTPDSNRLTRVLPVPVQQQKKKRRGGRVARRVKELHKTTLLRKFKNRMMMGAAEVVDEFTGEEMGMIGQHGSGITRVKFENNRILDHAITKKTRERMERAPPGHKNLLGTNETRGNQGEDDITDLSVTLVKKDLGPGSSSTSTGYFNTMEGYNYRKRKTDDKSGDLDPQKKPKL